VTPRRRGNGGESDLRRASTGAPEAAVIDELACARPRDIVRKRGDLRYNSLSTGGGRNRQGGCETVRAIRDRSRSLDGRT
jgi:hypothetical protein